MQDQSKSTTKGFKKYKSSFLESLFGILEDNQYPDLIHWGADESSFIIADVEKFSKNVLSNVYKHSNFSSFCRSLNMYDFTRSNQKLTKTLTFKHPLFLKGRKDLMKTIPRKQANTKTVKEIVPGGKKVNNLKESNKRDDQGNWPLESPRTSEAELTFHNHLWAARHEYYREKSPHNQPTYLSQNSQFLEQPSEPKYSKRDEYTATNYYREPFELPSRKEVRETRTLPSVETFPEFQLDINIFSSQFIEFRGRLEKLLGFDLIDKKYDSILISETEDLLSIAQKFHSSLKN